MKIPNSSGAAALIVVPVYKKETGEDEKTSLRHLKHYLGGHPVFYVKPAGLELADRDFPSISFDGAYFKNRYAYSRLLLSREFYEAFSNYEFMLIYQLDCLVFSDQLKAWCAKSFDYVGAPWFKFDSDVTKGFFGAGNGGFSLRRIPGFLEVLSSRRYPGNFFKLLHDFMFRPLLSRQAFPGLSRAFKKISVLREVSAGVDIYIKNYRLNEDVFWSTRAQFFRPSFNIAPAAEALRFSFETAPRYCYARNGGRLPFGCHAWSRYDRDFWQPYLLKDAHAV